MHLYTVADPGFSVVGDGVEPLGGHGPPTCLRFGENVCKKRKNWIPWGGGRAPEILVCRSATGTVKRLRYSPDSVLLFEQRSQSTPSHYNLPYPVDTCMCSSKINSLSCSLVN